MPSGKMKSEATFMKRLLSIFLTALLALGLAAPALAEGELFIVSPNSDGLLSIIPLFEQKTGIKVTVESLGTGDASATLTAVSTASSDTMILSWLSMEANP